MRTLQKCSPFSTLSLLPIESRWRRLPPFITTAQTPLPNDIHYRYQYTINWVVVVVVKKRNQRMSAKKWNNVAPRQHFLITWRTTRATTNGENWKPPVVLAQLTNTEWSWRGRGSGCSRDDVGWKGWLVYYAKKFARDIQWMARWLVGRLVGWMVRWLVGW